MEDLDPILGVIDDQDDLFGGALKDHDIPQAMGDLGAADFQKYEQLVPNDREGEARALQARDENQAPTYTWQDDLTADFADPQADVATEDEEENEKGHHYKLRAQDKHVTVTPAIDQDETGDYDPEAERQKTRPRSKKPSVRLSKLHVSDEDTDQQISKAPLPPPKLIITARFSSHKGRREFLELSERLRRQPRNDQSHVDFSQGYRLRKREGVATDTITTAPSPKKDPNAIGDATSLFAHPSARGCWGCNNLGFDCSLLHEEHSWPCNECRQCGNVCLLITQPVRKQVCESCRKRRSICSYTFTADHSGPCAECKDNGNPCVAAPDPNYVRTRIRYDRDWEQFPYPEQKAPPAPKKVWTCILCSHDGRTCSLSSQDFGDSSPGICTACDMRGKVCLPQLMSEAIQDKRKEWVQGTGINKRSALVDESSHGPPNKKQKSFDHAKKDISNSNKPQKTLDLKPILLKHKKVEPANKTSNKSNTVQFAKSPAPTKKPATTTTNFKTITTKLSHPVIFSHQPTEIDQCDFCTGDDEGTPTRLAIFGNPPRTIKVAVSPKGDKYLEMKSSRGLRMCNGCTIDRMNMITCPSHEFQPLPSNADIVTTAAEDDDPPDGLFVPAAEDDPTREAALALDAIFDDKPRPSDRWCSICPALASVECRKSSDNIQAMDIDDDDEATAEECCGLQLCENCHLELTEDYAGSFKKFVKKLVADGATEEQPLGLRADCELLVVGGLLYKTFKSQ